MFRHNSAIITEYKPSLKHTTLKALTIKYITFIKFLHVVNSVTVVNLYIDDVGEFLFCGSRILKFNIKYLNLYKNFINIIINFLQFE